MRRIGGPPIAADILAVEIARDHTLRPVSRRKALLPKSETVHLKTAGARRRGLHSFGKCHRQLFPSLVQAR